MSIYDRIVIVCTVLGQLSVVCLPLFFLINLLDAVLNRVTGRMMQFDLAGWVERKMSEKGTIHG